MQPTSNSFAFVQARLGVQPDMSDVLSFDKSYNRRLTTMRDLERGNTPALSSKTLIYDQSRIVSPMNYYGTRFIDGTAKVYRHNPAGMDGRNSTARTGMAFTKPFQAQYPQNL